MQKYSAIPINRHQIRQYTYQLRKIFGISVDNRFPVVRFIEYVLYIVDEKFKFCVVPDEELEHEYAKTYPLEHKILVRNSIYEQAAAGDGKCILILAHELGHYLLHSELRICFAKSCVRETMPKEYNVEWQADVFAYELMMPFDVVKKAKSDKDISKKYGVDCEDARRQMRLVNKEIQRTKIASKKKAKSHAKRFGKP